MERLMPRFLQGGVRRFFTFTPKESNVRIPVVSLQPQTRREFCAHACQAASIVALGSLAGCGGGSPTSPSSAAQLGSASATVAGRVVSVNVDAATALATVGSAAMVQTSLGTFLVARTAQDSFTALTATCTHQACTVTGFSDGVFVCPCHGSEYTTAGSVVRGPATRALQQFPTQFANGVLTFTG
jgi:cytochrome b6-f complex iron-sulfur subunit